MANPRYPQQQERQSSQDRKLSSIAGLVGLTNAIQGPQLEQRAAAEREHQNRVLAALQLLGINQQQQQDAATQGYRQQELQQRGDIASQERGVQQQHYTSEAEAAKKALAAHLFQSASAMPGTDLKTALRVGGIEDPAMGTEADAMGVQQRQQVIQTVYPQLRQITDPNAREAHGRAQLGKFPGAYEEALGLAFPQNGQGEATTPPPAAPSPLPGIGMFSEPSQASRQGGIFGAPTLQEQRASGVITNPNMTQPQAEYVIRGNLAQQAAENQRTKDSVWNFLFGNPR